MANPSHNNVIFQGNWRPKSSLAFLFLIKKKEIKLLVNSPSCGCYMQLAIIFNNKKKKTIKTTCKACWHNTKEILNDWNEITGLVFSPFSQNDPNSTLTTKHFTQKKKKTSNNQIAIPLHALRRQHVCLIKIWK